MLRGIVLVGLSVAALIAQGPKYELGRNASDADVAAVGISVLPDGRGLPEGSGTAEAGARIYENTCRECHGPEGEGGDQTALVGKLADLDGGKPKKTVGSYWPYATTLWDYTNRAMPFDRPGSLTVDQVYAVTAYVLHLNGLWDESEALNAETLPGVEMPNREGFFSEETAEKSR